MWKSTVELGYLRHPETTSRRFDFHTGAEATKGGGGAGICAKDLAEQDVVLMNFETLENDLGQEKFASPLLHVQWWRMMTDEAQMCKTGGPEMAVELAKINRWAVTGTPLSSSFDDLVSQLYFIELEPFMTVKPKDGIWEGLLDDAINHHRPPAIVALTNLVRLVMWRNLKKHVEDEVTLPALTIQNKKVTSSPAESVLYAHRYHEMRGVLEKELRARKARGEFAAREDVDEAAKLRAGRGLRLPKAKGTGNAESPEAWTLALRAMTDHAALFGATPTSKCPKTLDTDEAALEALPSALAAVEQTRLDVAQAFLSVAFCVEINQCVGCTRQFFTKSFLGDDVAVLAPSSGEEPASPRHRAGVASMAWRTTRRFRTNAP